MKGHELNRGTATIFRVRLAGGLHRTPFEQVDKDMKISLIRIVVALVMMVSVAGALSRTQLSSDEGKRKVKIRVNPHYPELARNMGVGGKVKIEVVIAPDGHVKSAQAVGRHALLVQACLDVIKEWKYEPTASESTQIVEFEFAPPH